MGFWGLTCQVVEYQWVPGPPVFGKLSEKPRPLVAAAFRLPHDGDLKVAGYEHEVTGFY